MSKIKTLTADQVRQQLEKNLHRHQINKVLHGHPSPMYWRAPKESPNLSAIKSSTVQKRRVNFYMGIPYCIPTNPPHCGFCLFPTEKYVGKDSLSTYLDHLEKEADMYVDFYQGATVEAIYVGGGTPNLMTPECYPRIMSFAQKIFPTMHPNIEKTLEGIPQLFKEDKIRAIKEAGFNRVSMGVQQMNDKLIKYSGRKQTRKQVFDAIELFHKYDLACNLDLIYGWPEQTTEDMLSDLQDAVNSGIRHITHYELNIGGRSDFATTQKNLVPDVPTKIAMYEKAKEFLLSQGFVRRTVYDWEKPQASEKFNFEGAERYVYENNLRELVKRDDDELVTHSMGAIGYAGVNIHMGDVRINQAGVAMMNHKNLAKYYEDITLGRLPVERTFNFQVEDIKLTWIFQCSQEMKISRTKYMQAFGDDLYEEFKSVWTVLEEKNWLETTDQEIRFINEGEFYIPTIQALLNKARLEEISAEARLM